MATPVTLPALGENVTEATVSRWLKQVGDHVLAGEPIVEISTDKVDTDIPAPVAGTLQQILATTDEEVQVGEVLGVIAESTHMWLSAPVSSEPMSPESVPKPAEPTPEAAESTFTAPDLGTLNVDQLDSEESDTDEPDYDDQDYEGAYVPPAVRRIAAAADIDLATVSGTGVGGRIRKRDVLEVIERRRSFDTTPAGEPLRARHLAESTPATDLPTATVKVDFIASSRFQEAHESDPTDQDGTSWSNLAFVVKAVTTALKEHHNVADAVRSGTGTITYSETVDVDIAPEAGHGTRALIRPDAKRTSSAKLAGYGAELIKREVAHLSFSYTPDSLSHDDAGQFLTLVKQLLDNGDFASKFLEQ